MAALRFAACGPPVARLQAAVATAAARPPQLPSLPPPAVGHAAPLARRHLDAGYVPRTGNQIFCAIQTPFQQQQQQRHTRHTRRRSLATSSTADDAAAWAQAAAAAAELEGGDMPTEQEMEEARQVLKEFLEGMGAAGEISRPEDMDLPEGRLTWQEANQLVGMAGWRLSGKVCPEIEELVNQLEGIFRAVLPEDQFGLYDLPERFKYLDSLDPEGRDPFAFRSLRDPPRGAPEYPRLQVENRAYWSRAFRKLHIEVAVRQDGLQVLHCVLYPRLQFDLPILSMDLVANDGRVSLAIVDPCPVTPNLQLPPFYEKGVRDLQERYMLDSNRKVPDWGQAIFSRLCVIMRPSSPEELGRFLKYTLALTQMHVQIAKIAHPVSTGGRRRVEAIHAAHQRYCEKQLENDKTRRVLEAAFGADLAARYMSELMFDCEPLPEGV